jgi:hypothetical protein
MWSHENHRFLPSSPAARDQKGKNMMKPAGSLTFFPCKMSVLDFKLGLGTARMVTLQVEERNQILLERYLAEN